MDPVAQFLVVVAAIFLIGAIGEIVFERTFFPDAIWLIVTGVVLGPVLGFVTREQLAVVAPHFAALTLVVVLFEGGSQIKLTQLAKVAPRAGALAVASFTAGTLAIALVTRVATWIGVLPASWGWPHALLVGCILGGSSSIIVMPAMTKAKLRPALADLVGLESAITDAFCVVGTAAMIDVIVAGGSETSPALSLLRSFGLALLIGGVAGLAWMLFLRKLKDSEHAWPITLAVLLLLYVAINAVGGSAALGILTVAILLGNAPAISDKFGIGEGFELGKDVRGVNTRIAFIIKSLFFTFIGLMLGPPWGFLALGVVIALFIAASRIPAAWLALLGSKLDAPSQSMVFASMPRGMAAGVLATLPHTMGVPDTQELPVFAFAAIVTTILIFAGVFPAIRKQLPTDDGESPSAAPSTAVPAEPSPGQLPVLELEERPSEATATRPPVTVSSVPPSDPDKP